MIDKLSSKTTSIADSLGYSRKTYTEDIHPDGSIIYAQEEELLSWYSIKIDFGGVATKRGFGLWDPDGELELTDYEESLVKSTVEDMGWSPE